MKKVITYGTYDLLHYGHIKLLERAKKLGDYLIVGVTSDDFDKQRGKINVQQSLMQRIKNVKETGLADEIIIEEYEGQKIDDIIKYGIDVFTVGSDWEGKFDYLNEYCKVTYLPRTLGISSTDIRSSKRKLKLGLVGNDANYLNKIFNENVFVNGIDITGICTENISNMCNEIKNLEVSTSDYELLLNSVDAVYIKADFDERYNLIKKALKMNKHVLCESPMSLSEKEYKELFKLAEKNKCILMEAIRTAYSTAYARLLLMVKTGKVGDVIAIDSTCTTLRDKDETKFNSLYEWGSNALLPVFQILGTDYNNKNIITKYVDKEKNKDAFTRVNFIYDNATATITVAQGAKSEGELMITGTKGYIYVPSPWWKTDYFECRYEDASINKRFFYQLEGEGIRNQLVSFARAIQQNRFDNHIQYDVSVGISKLMEDFKNKKDLFEIK